MLDHIDRVALKIAMVRLGLKQYELADRLGVTEGKLSAFIRGRRCKIVFALRSPPMAVTLPDVLPLHRSGVRGLCL